MRSSAVCRLKRKRVRSCNSRTCPEAVWPTTARSRWSSNTRKTTGAGEAAANLHITAQASSRVLAKRDPWTNMLRSTLCCAGAVLGGASSPQANGAGILGHIFGGQQNRAELGLGQATGLGGERAGQLLKILAPIVLAFIAQRMSQGGAQNNPLGLAEVLGQEQRQVQQQGGLGGGLLGAVLDQDGDGQLGLGDILKIGSGMFGGGR